MFVLNRSEERRDTFIRTITIRKPSSAPLGYDEHELTLEYRELGQDEINAIYYGEMDPKNPYDAKLLMESVVGWKDVNDDAGEPLPFNEDNLRALVNIPYVRAPAAKMFIEAMNGGTGERKAKN